MRMFGAGGEWASRGRIPFWRIAKPSLPGGFDAADPVQAQIALTFQGGNGAPVSTEVDVVRFRLRFAALSIGRMAEDGAVPPQCNFALPWAHGRGSRSAHSVTPPVRGSPASALHLQ